MQVILTPVITVAKEGVKYPGNIEEKWKSKEMCNFADEHVRGHFSEETELAKSEDGFPVRGNGKLLCMLPFTECLL